MTKPMSFIIYHLVLLKISITKQRTVVLFDYSLVMFIVMLLQRNLIVRIVTFCNLARSTGGCAWYSPFFRQGQVPGLLHGIHTLCFAYPCHDVIVNSTDSTRMKFSSGFGRGKTLRCQK